jgi:hypothetical protein
VAVLLSAYPIYRGDPTPLGVVDTGIGYQQVLGLLDPHGFDEDCTRSRPASSVILQNKPGSWPNGIKLVESHLLIDS